MEARVGVSAVDRLVAWARDWWVWTGWRAEYVCAFVLSSTGCLVAVLALVQLVGPVLGWTAWGLPLGLLPGIVNGVMGLVAMGGGVSLGSGHRGPFAVAGGLALSSPVAFPVWVVGVPVGLWTLWLCRRGGRVDGAE